MARPQPGHRSMSPSSIAWLPTTSISASGRPPCPATRPAAVMLRNVVASNNNAGLDAEGIILRVAHSVVTGNNTGVAMSGGGILYSYGDNDINGNVFDNTGVLTVITTH